MAKVRYDITRSWKTYNSLVNVKLHKETFISRKRLENGGALQSDLPRN